MIFSCASTKCRCNTSQRGDTPCWCYLADTELVCIRCKAPMTKVPPRLISEIGAALADAAIEMGADCERMIALIDEDHEKQREASPGVAVRSGLREGQRTEKE